MELQSRTFFDQGTDMQHLIVFMYKNNHPSKIEVILEKDNNGIYHFHYENDVCLSQKERKEFEHWALHEI